MSQISPNSCRMLRSGKLGRGLWCDFQVLRSQRTANGASEPKRSLVDEQEQQHAPVEADPEDKGSESGMFWRQHGEVMDGGVNRGVKQDGQQHASPRLAIK